MRAGKYFPIPERPADLEQLWDRASPLDQASLPTWLTSEWAAGYRRLSGPCHAQPPAGDAAYLAELEQLEAAGLIIDREPGNRPAEHVYIVEPPKWDVWSIGLYAGQSPFRLTPLPGAANPVLAREQVTDVPAVFVADPFMIRVRDTWYMYFEVMNWKANKGEIGLATSSDGLIWAYKQIVLAEEFHLSYPYVFHWGQEYYMVPESHQAGSVRLYRAVDFPRRWSLVTTLLRGAYYADSSVFRYEGKWWLFTETNPRVQHDTLRLYCADALTGPWHEHPRSPVVNNNPSAARPAGRVQPVSGSLIRYAQDCCPAYGTRVRAFEITELTASRYCEREVQQSPILAPGGSGWNGWGMHHIDAHRRSDGRWFACVDGWYRLP